MTPSTVLKENVAIHQILRGLWEILLSEEVGAQCYEQVYQNVIPQFPRLRDNNDTSIRHAIDGNVTQLANRVWMIKLGAGETLEPLAFDQAIEQMRAKPADRELISKAGSHIKFIFEAYSVYPQNIYRRLNIVYLWFLNIYRVDSQSHRRFTSK
jgi:hypothetical protein